MKIETKFKLGQTVFFLNSSGIVSAEITACNIYCDTKAVNNEIIYGFNGGFEPSYPMSKDESQLYFVITEKRCFSTREELIASL
ncbi:hypothetical protein [Sphingobacterium mizutaii]|uniref:hypothetical protein n=1 Tax=Sphingobacterium mizutaii TaxID=1010 RepID=UPI00289721A1|nr:hypothetical protein [Sphingobacterium mizutaii]